MKTYLVAFIISLFFSIALIPIVKRLAHYFRVYGPHKTSLVPRWGGVAIYFAFMAPLVGLFFYDNVVSEFFLQDFRLLAALFVGGTLVVILGVWDDFKNLSPLQKLIAEVAIASFVYWNGFRISLISHPFGNSLSLGYFDFPATVLWVVGMMNAVNLCDGIDGLAAGVSLFAVVTLGILSIMGGQGLNLLLCCALGGALLGFLRYNFNPAQIYLGDSGSLFLGYLLSIISIFGSQKASTLVALLTPVTILGLPILDVAVSIGRRYFRGLPIFSRDLEHIHHRLRNLGFSHRRVVLMLYGFCIILNGVGLAIFATRNPTWILVSLLIGTIFGLNYLGYLNRGTLIDRWEEFNKIRRDRFCRHVIRDLTSSTDYQNLPDKLWHISKGFSEKLHFDFAKLTLYNGRNGSSESFEWMSEQYLPTGPSFQVILPILIEGKNVGSLELKKKCLQLQNQHGPFWETDLLARELSKILIK